MLLEPGEWLGQGSLLVEGQSLGQGLACSLDVVADNGSCAVAVELDIKELGSRALSVRVTPNEVGTYDLNVRAIGATFTGTAKLDSAPNLGLLWNDAGSVHATFVLFEVAARIGCRGFLRDGSTTYTWEVALQLKQDTITGDNVVSLRNRRKR